MSVTATAAQPVSQPAVPADAEDPAIVKIKQSIAKDEARCAKYAPLTPSLCETIQYNLPTRLETYSRVSDYDNARVRAIIRDIRGEILERVECSLRRPLTQGEAQRYTTAVELYVNDVLPHIKPRPPLEEVLIEEVLMRTTPSRLAPVVDLDAINALDISALKALAVMQRVIDTADSEVPSSKK